MIYYFFLKRALTGEMKDLPICTPIFLGDIGDFISINGCGYLIVDFAVEQVEG